MILSPDSERAVSQKTSNSDCSDRTSPVGARCLKGRRAPRRLFVEVSEKTIGPTESSAPPKRIFEQLSTVYVKCSDPKCRDGGVHLMPIISEMLEHGETERLFMEMCPGTVPSPTNQAVRVRCRNMFCVKALLL